MQPGRRPALRSVPCVPCGWGCQVRQGASAPGGPSLSICSSEPLPWALGRVSLRPYRLRALSQVLRPWGSPGKELQWVSKSGVLGSPLPGAGLTSWGARGAPKASLLTEKPLFSSLLRTRHHCCGAGFGACGHTATGLPAYPL